MNQPTIAVQIENVDSRLWTTDADLKKTLAKCLRYRPKNYFHSQAYVAKRWDGWKHVFSEKTGVFPTGVLPEVLLALKKLEKPYVVQDARIPTPWKHATIGEHFLKPYWPEGKDPFTLHDYQPELVNQGIRFNRGVIGAPTGAGKTFVLVSLLHSLPVGTPILFITKNAGLVHQNWKEMKEWGVPNLGRWYGKYKEPNLVMCVTNHVDALGSIEKLLPKFKVLLVDEVHDCMSKVPQAAYRKMKSAYIRLGISATEYRYDKKKFDDEHKWNVKSHFGPTFKIASAGADGRLTTKQLQDRNILSKSDCRFYKMETPKLQHEPYQDAVKLGIEQNFHFHELNATLAKRAPGRTLIVTERLEQGKYLNQLIPGSKFIEGKMKLEDRDPILDSLCRGDRAVVIVMKQIITAGINVKIHDLINASGGEAAHNILQLIGRGLRPADDKDILRYHDWYFLNNDYLQDHSEWRMEVLKKEGHPVAIYDSIDDVK